MTQVNPHLTTAVREWGPRDAPLTVLGLHGRGQSPDLIGELRDRTGDERLRWVAPAAATGSWYPFRFMEEPPAGDVWLRHALEAVDHHLDALEREGWPPDRVVLLGFSQGACLLAHHALLHPRRYAGLAILTGGYIGVDGGDPGFSGDLEGTPTLIATRDQDDWVPLPRTLETQQQLQRLGAGATSLIESPGEHAVSDLAVLVLRHFLAAAPSAQLQSPNERGTIPEQRPHH